MCLRLHQVTFHLIWYYFHFLPNNAAHITGKVLKTHFLLVSFPPSLSPSLFRNSVMFNNELMADVHFMVGQPGRTQRLPGHRVRNCPMRVKSWAVTWKLTHLQQSKQSHSPEDCLPSVAAATGLRTHLCGALTSTPCTSWRRSSIIYANEAERVRGEGGGLGGEEWSSSVHRAAESHNYSTFIGPLKPHPPVRHLILFFAVQDGYYIFLFHSFFLIEVNWSRDHNPVCQSSLATHKCKMLHFSASEK